MDLYTKELPSPIGRLTAVISDAGLCRLAFPGEVDLDADLARRFGDVTVRRGTPPGDVIERLRAYFGGDLGVLDAIPVDLHGTQFQCKVWRALRRIATGKVISYGELARRIGAPTAVRAVGLANGANPVPVVVPCHRVIGSNGKLTGYGGGLDRKAWLLRHEGATFREAEAQAALGF
jgi:methylated-DNA-[protein]-cysteine S-methyltransferase